MKIAFLGINNLGKKVKAWLEADSNLEITLLTTKDDLKTIESLKPDLILSVGFRYIVPEKYLKIPKMGAINFHKSLLPLHRGANPVFWTLLEDTDAGITIHYMEEGIDTGDIIAQEKIDKLPGDNARDLYERLEERQLSLFQETWPLIKEGKNSGTPQNGEGCYHVKADFKKLRDIENIEFKNVNHYLNYLKAMTFPPFENAYFEKGGERYFVSVDISIKSNGSKSYGELKEYS